MSAFHHLTDKEVDRRTCETYETQLQVHTKTMLALPNGWSFGTQATVMSGGVVMTGAEAFHWRNPLFQHDTNRGKIQFLIIFSHVD